MKEQRRTLEDGKLEPNSPDEEDDTRMRRVACGDAVAFGALVRMHQGLISRYATRMLGGDADAGADVAQEVFVRLWVNRGRYEPRGTLRSYLLRIAHNLCLDGRRKSREEPWVASERDGSAIAPAPSLLAPAVRDAISQLPETQRAVFVLSEYEGLSYAEIAAMLECPSGTVASRKNQAVATLRQALAGWISEGWEGK